MQKCPPGYGELISISHHKLLKNLFLFKFCENKLSVISLKFGRDVQYLIETGFDTFI